MSRRTARQQHHIFRSRLKALKTDLFNSDNRLNKELPVTVAAIMGEQLLAPYFGRTTSFSQGEAFILTVQIAPMEAGLVVIEYVGHSYLEREQPREQRGTASFMLQCWLQRILKMDNTKQHTWLQLQCVNMNSHAKL